MLALSVIEEVLGLWLTCYSFHGQFLAELSNGTTCGLGLFVARRYCLLILLGLRSVMF